uniref:hypothetical protein n=1 Tax=Paractinoplanes polyasparticus TaxID=2856853 RepID=UPI001C841390|nr:hypothetical protein [Actinoplanes polyasparticus]
MIGAAAATAHADAISTVIAASTVAELCAALDQFGDLRRGATPGTAPGVSDDAPDRHYTNGYHLFTKRGRDVAATAIHSLPNHTLELWARLDEERRTHSETRRLIDDAAAERSGPGQPPIGRAVPVRLPEWLITLLETESREAGISRAQLIRELVMEGRAARRASREQA